MKILLLAGLAAVCLVLNLRAQAPGVPIVHEGHSSPAEWIEAAKKLREAGRLVPMGEIKTQLISKTSCQLKLPPANKKPLDGGEVWKRARNAHLCVGYFYLCNKCDKWHLNPAGGYALTADGAVATCFHVMEPKGMKEGYPVAVTEDGAVLPVTEVLAASKFTDSCIVRVQSDEPLEPLPLNANVSPGDDAWCYSDPSGRPSYFSKGIVNRFYQHWHGENSKEKFPVRLNVSTDWSPGSSGSAVLDRFGNAIGHVSRIAAEGEESSRDSTGSNSRGGETYIVFHQAVRAADVLALVKPGQ